MVSERLGRFKVRTVSNLVATIVSSDATLTVNRAPPAPTYDLSRDFSTTANPNGAWSYGWQSTLGGSFGLLPYLKTFASDNGVPLADWQLDTVGTFGTGT